MNLTDGGPAVAANCRPTGGGATDAYDVIVIADVTVGRCVRRTTGLTHLTGRASRSVLEGAHLVIGVVY